MEALILWVLAGNSEDNGFAALHIRGTEKYDNRHNEFGLMMNIYQSTNALLSDYPTQGGVENGVENPEETPTETPTEPTLTPFQTALSLNGTYVYNFLGTLESYNTTRYGISITAGILLASGYIAPTIRLGLDTYFGRSFGITIGGIYVGSSQVLVKNQFQTVEGGGGGELALVYNF